MAQDWLFVSEKHMGDLRVAGVMVKDGKLLVQRDADGSIYALPGGHVQMGETLEAALTREFREETGMAVTCSRMLWSEECFWTWKSKRAHSIAFYYLIESKDSSALPSDLAFVPHKDNPQVLMGWIPLEDVHHITIYPAFLKTEVHQLNGPIQHFITRE